MHRILKAHFDDFIKNHALEQLEEYKAFEAFTSYISTRRFSFDEIDPNLLVYEGPDPGIDSVFFAINESIYTEYEDIESLFKKPGKNNSVECVILQTKTSESWSKAEIANFESSVLDFISDEPKHKMSPFLEDKKKSFDFVIKNIGKIKDGKPNISCLFVNSAHSNNAAEIESAREIFSDRLNDVELFKSISVELNGRDSLIDSWIKITKPYEANFGAIDQAAFPKIDGVEESYVATVYAKDFIDNVLCDEAGLIRKNIFDQNVRDFLMYDDSINNEIKAALQNRETMHQFGILNNGVTIVSPDVKSQNKGFYISEYQIINGCQTSNILYDNKDYIDDKATLMLKIIETKDDDVIDRLVKSTNSQNKVDEQQFAASMRFMRRIEDYFNNRGADEKHKILFERRPMQYRNEDVPNVRIFDIKLLSRCVGAMFFDKPDIATRYPNQLIDEMRDEIFNGNNIEEIYYTAAYSYYRLKMHLSNQRIDNKYTKLSWYTLMAIKYNLFGKSIKNVTSAKINAQCEKICDFVTKNDMTKWNDIISVLEKNYTENRDELRSKRYLASFKESAQKSHKAKSNN